ncbi:MAG: hypothetical protein RLZZ292_758, partial [Bacteroidota bacterium]
SKATTHCIDEQYLLPCICRAADTKKAFFTKSNFEELKASDKNIFLFNASNSTDEKVIDYIKKGEIEAIDKKFLTANRTPWYSLENRPPAPIWVSVFNRTGLRFIRNEANISNLTSYHCIYPKQSNFFSTVDIDLLFAYLLTDTARQIFEDNSREYGNGLQKFEPNDLNKGMMLDLEIIDQKSKEQIVDLYQCYRNKVLQNQEGQSYINQIDAILVHHFLENKRPVTTNQ